jgi:1-acyl-sn-glycerol-3-phosphate acyltransferase
MQSENQLALDSMARAPHPEVPEALHQLTVVNLDDLVVAVGWQGHPRLGAVVRWLFRGAARKFARQVLDLDTAAGNLGLPAAARQALPLYLRGVRVFGRENLPTGGPLIVLANHPGMADTLALFASIARPDLRIIALNRPFLRLLPNISSHLFFIGGDAVQRVSAIRRTSAHLRAGGSVLTFPAGHNEPDPEVYGGAVESLQSWTDSIGVFVRLAPEARIVPVAVRSVLWEQIAHHPLLRLKRKRDERELLAVAVQLLFHVMFNARPVIAKVQIGKPISVKELGTAEAHTVHQAVLAEMKRLLENPPEGEGESIL